MGDALEKKTTTVDPSGDALALAKNETRSALFQELCHQYRQQLKNKVIARIDPLMQARVDPSDIVQEGLATAFRRLDDFVKRRPMPFHLWLWKTTLDRLLDQRRFHFAELRDVRREMLVPNSTQWKFTLPMLSDSSTPENRAIKQEQIRGLRDAIAELCETDQEILYLRYIDELSNAEAAMLLEIEESAASKRHGRALLRLTALLQAKGFFEELD